jgi:hypothetical protein
MPRCRAKAARSRLTLVRQSTTVPKTSNRQARISMAARRCYLPPARYALPRFLPREIAPFRDREP